MCQVHNERTIEQLLETKLLKFGLKALGEGYTWLQFKHQVQLCTSHLLDMYAIAHLRSCDVQANSS